MDSDAVLLLTVEAMIEQDGDFLNTASSVADTSDPDLANNEDLGTDGTNGGTTGDVLEIPLNATWAMFLMVLGLSVLGVRMIVPRS